MKTATETSVVDPVCGMTIDPATAAATSQHEGETIHFCAVGCKEAFDANPSAYAKEKSSGSCCGGNACHTR